MLENNTLQEPGAGHAGAAVSESGPGTSMGSLWRLHAQLFEGGQVARGDLTTDVAIVGAGVAGLSTALHLYEKGIDAVVLESGQPGNAATGASGGILAPDFSRDGVAKATRLYGREQAERLVRLVGRSAEYTFEFISRYCIPCDATQSGFVTPGLSARDMGALEADGRMWRSLGFSVEFLDSKRTAEAIGTGKYAGALLFDTGGALNPLAYASGMASVLHRSGVPIFTNSRVSGIERVGKSWILKLDNARIRANRVVLAANGGNAALHRSLCRTTMPLLVYEYATAPLPREDVHRYLGKAQPYTDRRTNVFTARLDSEGRLISAIPEVIPSWSDSRFVAAARRRIAEVYSMPVPSIEFSWPGTAYLNSSLLPAVYLPEGDLTLLAIQACNGRGLGINTIIGGQVAGLLANGNAADVGIPLSPPASIPMHRIARTLPKTLMSVAQLSDRLSGR